MKTFVSATAALMVSCLPGHALASDVVCVLNAVNVSKANFAGFKTVSPWESASLSLERGRKSAIREFDLSEIRYDADVAKGASTDYTFADLDELPPETKVTAAGIKRIDSLVAVKKKAAAIQLLRNEDDSFTVVFGSSKEALEDGQSTGFTPFGKKLGRFANQVLHLKGLPDRHEVIGVVSCVAQKPLPRPLPGAAGDPQKGSPAVHQTARAPSQPNT